MHSLSIKKVQTYLKIYIRIQLFYLQPGFDLRQEFLQNKIEMD